MKERSILFSGEMVRAIPSGAKSQTRRVVKLEQFGRSDTPGYEWHFRDKRTWCWNDVRDTRELVEHRRRFCPHGKPGDRLWVKESHYLHGRWRKNGTTAKGRQLWRFVADRSRGVLFPDDPPEKVARRKDEVGWFARNSLFMPRWASRLTLEIESVRVERLQEIGEEDAKAEGVVSGEYWDDEAQPVKLTGFYSPGALDEQDYALTPSGAYRDLWESLHGPGSWDANPWVWVIGFRRTDAS